VIGPNGRRARLDLAYPEFSVAIEYDGDHHRNREVYATDRRRDNWLAEAGWLILRFTATDALGQPEAIAQHVRQALHQRSHQP
jgi:very-short-patch-repair endonuclease